MKPDSVLTKQIVFPYSGIDAHLKPKMTHILHFFQDMASEHSSYLKVSGLDLREKNYKWVISKYHIKVHHKIKWMDELIVETWRSPFKNLYEIREFKITDHNQNVVITAVGIWIMIKIDTLKPVRLDRFLPEAMLISNQPNNIDLPKISCPDRTDIEKIFYVHYQDIDQNLHVNNTVYLNWAMETVPVEILQTFNPLQIDISFHHESSYGQKINSRVHLLKNGNELITYHQILDFTDHTVLSLLQIKWTSDGTQVNT